MSSYKETMLADPLYPHELAEEFRQCIDESIAVDEEYVKETVYQIRKYRTKMETIGEECRSLKFYIGHRPKIQSVVVPGAIVNFPEYLGEEKIYMVEVKRKQEFPVSLQRWRNTISQMTAGVPEEFETMYVMVDCQSVKQAEQHRRGGLHVDGYWLSKMRSHFHAYVVQNPPPEAILLASNMGCTCAAYNGTFYDMIGNFGYCGHIKTKHMERVVMEENRTYIGNAFMLHESLPMPFDYNRMLVRINIPGWAPNHEVASF